jgi:hypothetical protein
VPDLVIAGFSAPDTVVAGSTIDLFATVKNEGNANASTTTIGFYRSTNPITDKNAAGVTLLGGTMQQVAALDIGTTSDITLATSAPNNADRYYYAACVVAIPSGSETSNSCSSLEVEVTPSTPAPDLVIADFSVPDIAVVGNTIDLSATIGNRGDATASDIDIVFYFSTSATINAAEDASIGMRNLATLADNAVSNSVTFAARAPSDIGSYYYGVCVKITGDEENRDNNCSEGTALRVSSWQRSLVTTGWSVREHHTSLVFQNKMWILGGFVPLIFTPGTPPGTPPVITPSKTLNNVWSSENGKEWTQATDDANWDERQGHTSLVFQNKMWVLGGMGSSNELNDVWYSENGREWMQATDDAKWSERSEHTSLVFEGKMWVLGGGASVTRLNDVWSSENGKEWTQVTSGASWPIRISHTSLVFDNKMWVIGGEGTGATALSDIW